MDKLDIKIIIACTIILLVLQPVIASIIEPKYLNPESVTKPQPTANPSYWTTYGNVSCNNATGEMMCFTAKPMVYNESKQAYFIEMEEVEYSNFTTEHHYVWE